ncbi:preprotein translocase subunit SecY [Lentisphaerota bacterium WC36G]|nr:preprotein translocase subunit SecY [Lentisphaerae bacterium WC36]
MFSAFINCFKVKDLRDRILFTVGIILLCRLAANIPCPGVDTAALKAYISSFQDQALFGVVDIFSGGAISNFAIAALGVMPYISASIIMQLMMPVIPTLEKLQREGESGRQKINQYTRYLTIVICMFQGIAIVGIMMNPRLANLPTPKESLVLFDDKMMFMIPALIILTCGTMIFMWLGEQVTERGIGQGVSIIIAIGILSRLPQAVGKVVSSVQDGTLDGVKVIILLIIFFSVTAATIMFTQGVRKVPIQMIRKSIGGFAQPDTTYMPLKVGFAGVMPIIFASTLMTIPGLIIGRFQGNKFVQFISPYFSQTHPVYTITFAVLIILFSYFWVANQFNPMQIADNLKKDGAYIPGIRPGQPTAQFLDGTMNRVTFAGTMMLTFLAVFPSILSQMMGIDYLVASFFGGTSLLIMAGVVLDTLSQMESHLTMRNYEGFLKSGKLRSRSGV